MNHGDTRYARQEWKRQQEERHAEIVDKLTRDVRASFDYETERHSDELNCRNEGWPSRWTDYDSVPAHREPQDQIMPTAAEAEELCEGCPLMKADLCFRYALSTDQAHGIWGGRRFENGHVVSDGRDAVDRPNREKRYR